MKLRKIVSGILACAMIFSSVPVAGNEVGGGVLAYSRDRICPT